MIEAVNVRLYGQKLKMHTAIAQVEDCLKVSMKKTTYINGNITGGLEVCPKVGWNNFPSFWCDKQVSYRPSSVSIIRLTSLPCNRRLAAILSITTNVTAKSTSVAHHHNLGAAKYIEQ